MTARRTFPCRREAVTAARHFVREAMAEQPRETIDAAELMTSELASNCIRHAQSDFELVVRTGREIRIELHDHGDGSPTVLSPTPRQVTGRGLLIVAAMSSDWGVIPTPTGKQVWFTLPSRPRSVSGSGVPSESALAERSAAGTGPSACATAKLDRSGDRAGSRRSGPRSVVRRRGGCDGRWAHTRRATLPG